MKINIKENLLDAYAAFDSLKKSQIHSAARRAINRTLVTVRKESVGIIKKGLRVKSSVLKSYIYLQKPNQKRFYEMQGAVVYQSRGLALIDFVRGQKKATPLKGVKVKKRRKVRVEITPGKKVTLNKAFISRTQKGLQVMKGTGSRTLLKMQTAPSIGQMLMSRKKNVGVEIQTLARQRFELEFSRELKHRLNNLTLKRKVS